MATRPFDHTYLGGARRLPRGEQASRFRRFALATAVAPLRALAWMADEVVRGYPAPADEQPASGR